MATDKDGTVEYLHVDHLGSPVATTNSSGTVIGTHAFYPFGEVRTSTGSFDTQRGFTGQISDSGTGLNFYNARYQDPVLGRFISPDSIVPNPVNPGHYNRLVYVSNNPLRFVDPSGHYDCSVDSWHPACDFQIPYVPITPTAQPGVATEDRTPDGRETETWVTVNNPYRNGTSGPRLFPTNEEQITIRVYWVEDGGCRGFIHCAVGRNYSFAPPGFHINIQKRHANSHGLFAHEIFHSIE